MNDVIFKGIWVLLGIIMLRYYAKKKTHCKISFFRYAVRRYGTCDYALFWKSYRIFSAAESF